MIVKNNPSEQTNNAVINREVRLFQRLIDRHLLKFIAEIDRDSQMY